MAMRVLVTGAGAFIGHQHCGTVAVGKLTGNPDAWIDDPVHSALLARR